MLDQDVKKEDKGTGFTPAPKGQLPFPLYLSKTQKAVLYVPSSLSRKELKLLTEQIQNSLSVIEATILSDESDEPQPESKAEQKRRD
jgi:hypothetical protein